MAATIEDIQADIADEVTHYVRLVGELAQDAESCKTVADLRENLDEAEGWAKALLENLGALKLRAMKAK